MANNIAGRTPQNRRSPTPALKWDHGDTVLLAAHPPLDHPRRYQPHKSGDSIAAYSGSSPKC
jgi:hypothetical protein